MSSGEGYRNKEIAELASLVNANRGGIVCLSWKKAAAWRVDNALRAARRPHVDLHCAMARPARNEPSSLIM